MKFLHQVASLVPLASLLLLTTHAAWAFQVPSVVRPRSSSCSSTTTTTLLYQQSSSLVERAYQCSLDFGSCEIGEMHQLADQLEQSQIPRDYYLPNSNDYAPGEQQELNLLIDVLRMSADYCAFTLDLQDRIKVLKENYSLPSSSSYQQQQQETTTVATEPAYYAAAQEDNIYNGHHRVQLGGPRSQPEQPQQSWHEVAGGPQQQQQQRRRQRSVGEPQHQNWYDGVQSPMERRWYN